MKALGRRGVVLIPALILCSSALLTITGCEADTADSAALPEMSLAPAPNDMPPPPIEYPDSGPGAKATTKATPQPDTAEQPRAKAVDPATAESPAVPSRSAPSKAPAPPPVTKITIKPPCGAVQLAYIRDSTDRVKAAEQDRDAALKLIDVAQQRIIRATRNRNTAMVQALSQEVMTFHGRVAAADLTINVSNKTINDVRLTCREG